MILLLDIDEQAFHYCCVDHGRTIMEKTFTTVDLLKEGLRLLYKDQLISLMGYRIRNGGRYVDRPVMEITPSLIAHIGEEACFDPALDILMKEVVVFCRELFLESRHFILCESAFFLNMPAHSRLYAIPLKYAQDGIQKYGRNGLIHEWAAKKVAPVERAGGGKLISVFLNDRTDVVALKGGKPVASSHGFSDLDGMMSVNGCGAIDTSIVFQLFAEGASAQDIHRILSQESGFKALSGNKQRTALAGDIFAYQLIKMIGAFMAVLEGADALVFIGEGKEGTVALVFELLRQMEFLGLKVEQVIPGGDLSLLTAADSSVRAYYLDLRKGPLLAQILQAYARLS